MPVDTAFAGIGLNEAQPELFATLMSMKDLLDEIEDVGSVDRGTTNTARYTEQMRDLKTRAQKEAKLARESLNKEQLKVIRNFVEAVITQFKIIIDDLNHRLADRDAEAKIILEPPPTGAPQLDTMRTASLVAKGDKAQDDTEAAIGRMKQMVVEAEEVGVNTAKKMDDQIEQMERVGDKLGHMKEQNREGRARLRELGKGALRDRCIQIMVAIIVLLLIANITILVIRKT